jgi:hypothetical protein
MNQQVKRLILSLPLAGPTYRGMKKAAAKTFKLQIPEAEPPRIESRTVAEFVDRWCGKDLMEEARRNLYASKAHTPTSPQPSLGVRWGDYSNKLINDIDKLETIVQAISHAQTEIGFETRPTESQCGAGVDMMLNLIDTNYAHCADMIARSGESPLSLITHDPGVIRRNGRIYCMQQINNVEVFCFNVTQLGGVPRTVLEIGGGYGNSCRDIINMAGDRIDRYYILDLPESLFYAEVYLKAHFGSDVVGHLADEHVAQRPEDFRIILCPVTMIDRISAADIELAINVGSMQEMPGEWLEYYDRFLSNSGVRNFYSSNFFLQPLSRFNEGMNLFTPRLSNEWTPRHYEFMRDTDEAERRHVLRGIFARRTQSSDDETAARDTDQLEAAPASELLDPEKAKALLRLLLAIRNGASATVALRVVQLLTRKFSYVPKEALYVARLLARHPQATDAERRVAIAICRDLEAVLAANRKDVA